MVRLEPLYFIGPDTEAQGGSVYPHDPGEYLGLPRSSDAMGEGADLRKFLWQRCDTTVPPKSTTCLKIFKIHVCHLLWAVIITIIIAAMNEFQVRNTPSRKEFKRLSNAESDFYLGKFSWLLRPQQPGSVFRERKTV